MDIENLICDFNAISINREKFILNNDLKIEKMKFYCVTDVTLNFYQIWSIFNMIPIVSERGNGKKVYEWRFTTSNCSDIVFIISNKNSNNNFINTKHWRILCNKKDTVIRDSFLATLCEALECYNLYYKEAMESHKFNSNDPSVNSCLEHIKRSIIKNKDILKSI